MAQRLEYANLVGYLIGSIMPRSKALLIAIYAHKDGTHSTSVISGRANKTTYWNVVRLAQTYKPVLQGVFANDAIPSWYYLQFDEHHPPTMLHGWDLPIQVYGPWSVKPLDAPGLVGLSISPQLF